MRDGKPPIYFDNACTTLVPQQVIRAITDYYEQHPACGGGRSRHWFAEEVIAEIDGDAAAEIEGSRQIIADFINAGSEKEIVFTANASHAINIVALGFPFRRGDVVLLTDREHNSNLVPWLRLQNKGSIRVDYCGTGEDGAFDLEAFRGKLESGPVRLVSMAYTSNVTGCTLPAKAIIDLAHCCGARVLLDAAQTAPHRAMDVQDLDVDFLAFSIHKMCGPRGVGILYGKGALLRQAEPGIGDDGEDAIEPVLLGGGAVHDATYQGYRLLDPPERFEVGVQNYAGQIAAGAAVNYLQAIGMDRIDKRETELNGFLTEELLKRYGDTGWFRIIGPREAAQRGGLLTFEIKRPNAVGITEELSARSSIMIRDGVFCVHSYFNKLYGEGWTRPKPPSEHKMVYRLSLYFYNTLEECRTFLDTLHDIFEERSYI
ncbi:MAG: aminotransferase class V-fold PLP-dependent enzyme [Deltaproteobacteria bacterium]|nr:aminotransferase class V-fold PLP-dependent enzyme [Deltaproteobacteria bacterium]